MTARVRTGTMARLYRTNPRSARAASHSLRRDLVPYDRVLSSVDTGGTGGRFMPLTKADTGTHEVRGGPDRDPATARDGRQGTGR